MFQTDLFFDACDRWCRARGLSEARLSKLLFSSGADIARCRAGEREIGSRRIERAIARLAMDWPDEAAWPAGLHRPTPAECAEILDMPREAAE